MAFTITFSAILSAVSGGAVAAIVVWFGRTVLGEGIRNAIKAEYDQRLETHKAQLKAASDIATEQLKSRLAIEIATDSYRFTKLHERRVEVIAETYGRLKTLHKALTAYFAVFEPAGIASKEERRKAATVAFEKFDEFYQPSQIFLPAETNKSLLKIRQTMVTSFNRFFFSVEAGMASGDNTGSWLEIFESMQGPMQIAFSELEEDLRVLLGEPAKQLGPLGAVEAS